MSQRGDGHGRDGTAGGGLLARSRAAGSRAPALAGVALGLLALAEVLARLALDPGSLGRLVTGTAARSASPGLLSLAAPTVTSAAVAGDVSGKAALALGLLCLCTTLPLVFLRPGPAAVAVTAASVLSLGLVQVLTVAGAAAQLIALYRVGRAGSLRLALALAAPFPVLALAALADSSATDPGGFSVQVLVVVLASLSPAAALAGFARRARTEAVVHSEARQVIAGSLMEHTARGERARIARELHDVVAHHISMVAVQAETARLTTEDMPAAGAQRLLAIGDTARAALTEMRRLLGVLREDTEGAVADRQPQPGLRQLNELIDEARDASGAGTRLIVSGSPAALDPGVELAAYRIVQEALTNARRHAPGAAVDVELRYADAALSLRIRDNGPGPPWPANPGAEPAGSAQPEGPAADSHGLLGMQERAAAVGGELRTRTAPGGGFVVEASLPGKSEAL